MILEALSGNHNTVVQEGLLFSFLLFVFSELIFFVSVFWVFLDASMSPSIEIGCVWPPYGIVPPDYLGLAFLGTIILLRRGVLVSWSHAQLLSNEQAKNTLLFGRLLGGVFLILQMYEYRRLTFSIRDSIYGSLFYFSTGFHGLHVFVGVLFLVLNLIRIRKSHFSCLYHLGFLCSILY